MIYPRRQLHRCHPRDDHSAAVDLPEICKPPLLDQLLRLHLTQPAHQRFESEISALLCGLLLRNCLRLISQVPRVDRRWDGECTPRLCASWNLLLLPSRRLLHRGSHMCYMTWFRTAIYASAGLSVIQVDECVRGCDCMRGCMFEVSPKDLQTQAMSKAS